MRATSSDTMARLIPKHFSLLGDVLDPTYGRGGFWNWKWEKEKFKLISSDLDKRLPTDHHWDFRRLPRSLTVSLTVFDPPFTAAGCSTWADRYGICRKHGGPADQGEVLAWLLAGTAEAIRVSQRGVIVKFKSCVESGILYDHWTPTLALLKGSGMRIVEDTPVWGQRPQPTGRIYTNPVQPTRYVVAVKG